MTSELAFLKLHTSNFNTVLEHILITLPQIMNGCYLFNAPITHSEVNRFLLTHLVTSIKAMNTNRREFILDTKILDV